eukprot:jgi/Hompol1/4904/HPOL_004014-RA
MLTHLRDLVACPIGRREVFFVNQNSVQSMNTHTKEVTFAMRDLPFSPTSMTTGCGFLAAGGQRSQLVVNQLSSSWYRYPFPLHIIA